MADQVSDLHKSPAILSLTQANNYLAVSLHKQLAKDGRNVFFSPFSISTALAMLFCGSDGETAKEMRQVLGYEIAHLEDEGLKESFKSILGDIESSQKYHTLACANSILIRNGFPVKKEYQSLLKKYFKAALQEIDIARNPAKAIKKINKWVSRKTNKMIPSLLETLEPSTVTVLLNAIYFKGSWVEKFNKSSTRKRNFYNNGEDDNCKQVDMMHLNDKKFQYSENEIFKALELPYKGGEMAMIVLLPKTRNGLKQLEDSVSQNIIQDLKNKMYETDVNVALPKFKLEYSKPLKEQFQTLGLNHIFVPGADFSGINDSNQLLISEIFHKAVLEVNEKGSKAAATTCMMIEYCSVPIIQEFVVDHPFMFVIYNKVNDLIMFMGTVNEL